MGVMTRQYQLTEACSFSKSTSKQDTCENPQILMCTDVGTSDLGGGSCGWLGCLMTYSDSRLILVFSTCRKCITIQAAAPNNAEKAVLLPAGTSLVN